MFSIRIFVRFSSTSVAKKRLKGYKLPEIIPEECEEKHVRGWGPGGSNVNSAGNAVILKHKRTNCVVKVHESRNLHENIRIAYKRLKFAVDRHLNGENSYEAQFERLKRQYEERAEKEREKRKAKTEELKREGEEVKRREKGGERGHREAEEKDEERGRE
ncbi:hypothetical protein niasHS_013301 [Heterodera schachtii]|uniref:Prokaryotic-type class I peptide chain release factors domain-containing protein n=1 Tax=Heterodera schachtii TaxID=97005 RepID=A0ABD2IH43_HETSC